MTVTTAEQSRWAKRFLQLERFIEEHLSRDEGWSHMASRLRELERPIATTRGEELPRGQFCALTIIASRAWAQRHGPLSGRHWKWMRLSTSRTVGQLLGVSRDLETLIPASLTGDLVDGVNSQRSSSGDPFECMLCLSDRETRRRQGIYFTPQPVADRLVDGASRMLANEFGLERGWVDETPAIHYGKLPGVKKSFHQEPFIRIFEPSLGSGSIVMALLRQASADWQRVHGSRDDWSPFVANSLLPRIWGNENHPVPLILAHFNLAQVLSDLQFDFEISSQLQLRLANSLANHSGLDESYRSTGRATVYLGNPPFGALSSQRFHDSEGLVDYWQCESGRIQERKTWLHDLYVQFIKLCHVHLVHRGCGLMGLITNRGYLDNVTFRGMRYQLLRSFDAIEIMEIQRAARQRVPNTRCFDVASGVAIGYFCRRWANAATQPKIRLTTGLDSARGDSLPISLRPTAPNYFFTGGDHDCPPEYAESMSLPDVMPVFGSAVITARDWLVTDRDRDTLFQRLNRFADPNVSDAQLRKEWFTRSRSSKHLPGDSRGWKLVEARNRIRQDHDWSQKIETCGYRPLEDRFIFWAEYMIDWPRHRISDQLRGGGNLALIARRQSPPDLDCDYFWLTSKPVIDGILRSDNRGNESVFPLQIFSQAGKTAAYNFSDEFQSRVHRIWRLDRHQDMPLSQPANWLAYIYALFHASMFRQRYANQLRTDFPRILLTSNRTVARALVRHGQELIRIHQNQSGFQTRQLLSFQGKLGETLLRRPRYEHRKLWLNESCFIGPLASHIWQFRVGAYRVLPKWLKSHAGVPVDREFWLNLRQAIAQLERFHRCISHIDLSLQRAGSWQQIFSVPTVPRR